MKKTILITGATDGIGFETAKSLVAAGHHVIIHGRNPEKVKQVSEQLASINSTIHVETLIADLSQQEAVNSMTEQLESRDGQIDIVINNAGIFTTSAPINEKGIDIRFMVNTLAPYQITKALLPLMPSTGRVVNLSSAAQKSVNLDALAGKVRLGDNDAYAQSKLALTMWSHALGKTQGSKGPVIVSVNPKSFLGSKMVNQAYGIAGSDLSIGADILVRAALSDEFATAQGRYYDNDIGAFADAHPDTYQASKVESLLKAMDDLLADR